MDPEKIMNGISTEIITALKAMKKAETPEERLMHSETVKNLCDSLGVFVSLIGEMASYGDGDGDDEPIPF